MAGPGVAVAAYPLRTRWAPGPADDDKPTDPTRQMSKHRKTDELVAAALGGVKTLGPEHLEAIRLLLIDTDDQFECYATRGHCEEGRPACGACRSREAHNALRRLIDFECRTRHPERLMWGHAERIYFEEWVKENRRDPALNSGIRTLEAILNPELGKPAAKVSQHDAEICTTLVQWFGTNCGRAFLDRCERRIKEERAQSLSYLSCFPGGCHYFEWRPRPLEFTHDRVRHAAEILAANWRSAQSRESCDRMADDIHKMLLDVLQAAADGKIELPSPRVQKA